MLHNNSNNTGSYTNPHTRPAPISFSGSEQRMKDWLQQHRQWEAAEEGLKNGLGPKLYYTNKYALNPTNIWKLCLLFLAKLRLFFRMEIMYGTPRNKPYYQHNLPAVVCRQIEDICMAEGRNMNYIYLLRTGWFSFAVTEGEENMYWSLSIRTLVID